jgi:hypothetical protein
MTTSCGFIAGVGAAVFTTGALAEAQIVGIMQDIAAAASVGIGMSMLTTGNVYGVIVNGYLWP